MSAREHNLNNCVILKNGNNENLTPDKFLSNTNVRSPNVELTVGMKSHSSEKKHKPSSRKHFSTPYKQSDHYAGPTFHHSPAASNLPIPTFLPKPTHDIIQSQPDIHFEQSGIHSPPSILQVSPTTSLHQFLNSPHSSFTSQTYLSTSPHEQAISDPPCCNPSVDSSHAIPVSLLELIFQEDKNKNQQNHTLLNHELVVSLDRKKKSEQSTFQSTHHSDLQDIPQKLQDNRQKSSCSKKNRARPSRNADKEDYKMREEMKHKLLSLLLPSSPKSSKPITTNFPKSKKKQNLS
ncbi:hypothetical protein PCK2_000921 [Pneumocystis canis]|nr:hypothetical protein PCK2_000921 [Pneumocystis canis]